MGNATYFHKYTSLPSLCRVIIKLEMKFISDLAVTTHTWWCSCVSVHAQQHVHRGAFPLLFRGVCLCVRQLCGHRLSWIDTSAWCCSRYWWFYLPVQPPTLMFQGMTSMGGANSESSAQKRQQVTGQSRGESRLLLWGKLSFPSGC